MNYIISIVKVNAFNDEYNRKIEFAVKLGNNVWEYCETIETADLIKKYLENLYSDTPLKRPFIYLAGKKHNGFTEKSVQIEISKVKSKFADYRLSAKPFMENRFYIFGELITSSG